MLRLFLTAVVVFIGLINFSGFVFAQGSLENVRSELYRQSHHDSYQRFYRSQWNGKGHYLFFSPIMSEPEARPQMGFTEEQYQQLRDMETNIRQNHPDVVAARAELEQLHNPDDPYMINASDQEKANYHAIMGKISHVSLNILPEAIEQMATPEQKQHLREYSIAGMSEFPAVNPDMFEALDLSEEQREQLQAIKKELEPELDQIALEQSEDHLRALEKHFEAVEILENSGITEESDKEFEKKLNLEMKKLIQADPEYSKKEKAAHENAMDYAKRLKFRMFDVLTDEQMEKMQRIIDNPPDYVKKILNEIRKEREEAAKSEPWKPGPNSWQPGDPIPEEYLKHRREKARFPKKTQRSTSP